MSLNYIQALEPVAAYDPRIDFDTEDQLGPGDADKAYGDKYLVYRGPKNIEYFEISPTSGDNNTAGSTDFTYFMPSRESVLDRTIFLRSTITVKIEQNTASAASQYVSFFQNGRFALQAFPLHHCLRVLQLQIDGSVYTVDLQNSFEHMKYYNYTEDEIKTWSSLCPTLLDNSSVYEDASGTNVLSVGKESGTSLVPPRGAFLIKSIKNVSGSGTVKRSSTIEFEVTEPVQLSPLIFNAINQQRSTGLTGLSNIKIKLTWKGEQESFLSGFKYNPYNNNCIYKTLNGVDGTPADPTLATFITGLEPALVTGTGPYATAEAFTGTLKISGIKMLVGILSVPDVTISPPINSYDFIKYETHTEDGSTLAVSGKFPITSKNYNLSQIPHAVLLAVNLQKNGSKFTNFIGKPGANTTPETVSPIYVYTIPDFYFGISNVNIKLGNRSGLLANCPPELLYLMNRNNGCEFCNFTNSGMKEDKTFMLNATGAINTSTTTVKVPQGCPLLLRFGKDIAIDDSSLAPGVATNTNFQVKLSCNNQYQGECAYTLTLIFIYQGIYTVATTGSSFVTAPLSREDVLRSDVDRVDITELEPVSGGVMVGGSFLSKLKKIGKKAYNIMKNPRVQKLLREGLNIADEMGVPMASQVNTALNTLEAAKGNGMYRAGILQSSSVVGGQILSSAELRKRLMR